jgi:pimeloyl-ACP methyl ester carboxylesterase
MTLMNRCWSSWLLTLFTVAGLGCGAPNTTSGRDAGERVADAGPVDVGAVDAGADAGSPCTLAPPASERVQVNNAFGPLVGTLVVPPSCGPVPVVLLVSGTGTQDRDGNDGPGSPYQPATQKRLAEVLLDAGIASLRYDDHGAAESFNGAPPRVEDFSFDLEVADAARWIALLRQDTRFSTVSGAGHSQGSLTLLVAHQTAPLDGFVSLAGTSLRAGRLLMQQATGNLDATSMAQLSQAVAELEEGALPGPLPAPLDNVLPVELQPYLRSYFKFDPVVELGRVGVPVLIAHGSTDRTVPVAQASQLQAARPTAKLVIVQNMAHTLKRATASAADQQAARSNPNLPIARELADALAAFVHELRR